MFGAWADVSPMRTHSNTSEGGAGMAPGRKLIFTDVVVDSSCIQAFKPERVLGEPELNAAG